MNRRLLWCGAAACFAMLLGVGAAHADIVYFSGALSDNDTDISHFNARVEWDYSELDQLLALTIYNDTVSPFGYTISVLRFNASDDVTNLSLITNNASPLYNSAFPGATFNGPTNGAGGFGSFDWGLDFGTGNTGLLQGGVTTFHFNVTGSNITNEDFFSHNSNHANGGGLAIIHFTRGPGDDSVWAIPGELLEEPEDPSDPPGPITVVPEPASMTLLGLGVAAMALGRMRRRR